METSLRLQPKERPRGMKLALNVLAMLVAFVGLIALFNWGLGLVVIGGNPLSLN